MKPSRRPRRARLAAVLALGLVTGAAVAGGAGFAAENARLGARIRMLESRALPGGEAASRPPEEKRQPAARRPDPETTPSPYTTGGEILKLLGEGGIEVSAYTLEPEKNRFTLSGNAEPEALISFFGLLPGSIPAVSFEEFELSRNAGERKLHFGFTVVPGDPGRHGDAAPPPPENESRVLRLFSPPQLPGPSGRRVAANTKRPEQVPPELQPADPSPSLRYIGSAVMSGTLRLYLMDEKEMIHEQQITLTDHYSPDLFSIDPYSAASDSLQQPRP